MYIIHYTVPGEAEHVQWKTWLVHTWTWKSCQCAKHSQLRDWIKVGKAYHGDHLEILKSVKSDRYHLKVFSNIVSDFSQIQRVGQNWLLFEGATPRS